MKCRISILVMLGTFMPMALLAGVVNAEEPRLHVGGSLGIAGFLVGDLSGETPGYRAFARYEAGERYTLVTGLQGEIFTEDARENDFREFYIEVRRTFGWTSPKVQQFLGLRFG